MCPFEAQLRTAQRGSLKYLLSLLFQLPRGIRLQHKPVFFSLRHWELDVTFFIVSFMQFSTFFFLHVIKE